MIVVLPISHRDVAAVGRLSKALSRLNEKMLTHTLFIVRTKRLAGSSVGEEIARWFGACKTIDLTTEDERGHPWSANHLFAETALAIEALGASEPWYFMELDNLPLKKGWLYALNAEYQQAGKPCMGVIHPTRIADLVDGKLTVVGTNGQHMTGTSIYPPNLRDYTTRHLEDLVQSWDVECRDDLLPHCHHTNLIQHNWGTQNYHREDDLIVCEAAVPGISLAYAVRDDAVVLHGCKDNSLFDLIYPNDGLRIEAARDLVQEITLELYRELRTEVELRYGDSAKYADEFFHRTLWPAAQMGEAVLVAMINGVPAGAIFWAVEHNEISVWHGAAVAYGTYVRPEHRRHGVSKLLREAGLNHLRSLGVKRMFGAFHEGNAAGEQSRSHWGFKPYQRVEVLDL